MGKRAGRPPVVTTTDDCNSDVLFLYGTITKQLFLVNTRVEVSILPTTGLDSHTQKTGPQLLATIMTAQLGCMERTHSPSISPPTRIGGI